MRTFRIKQLDRTTSELFSIGMLRTARNGQWRPDRTSDYLPLEVCVWIKSLTDTLGPMSYQVSVVNAELRIALEGAKIRRHDPEGAGLVFTTEVHTRESSERVSDGRAAVSLQPIGGKSEAGVSAGEKKTFEEARVRTERSVGYYQINDRVAIWNLSGASGMSLSGEDRFRVLVDPTVGVRGTDFPDWLTGEQKRAVKRGEAVAVTIELRTLPGGIVVKRFRNGRARRIYPWVRPIVVAAARKKLAPARRTFLIVAETSGDANG